MNHISAISVLFEQLPGCWGCRDKTSTFVYVNRLYSNLIGVLNQTDVIGKTDFELPDPLPKCAEMCQLQDQQVMATGRKMQVLNIHPYPDGQWHAHIVTKMPWHNESGELLGTIFHGQAVNDCVALEVGQWICKAIGKTDPQENITTSKCDASSLVSQILSTRESEVLFFHLYGKKPQFIADILGVSVKTIENHFANLRLKLGVKSKNELTEHALERGYGSNIPQSLLKQQLCLVLTE